MEETRFGVCITKGPRGAWLLSKGDPEAPPMFSPPTFPRHWSPTLRPQIF